MISETGRHNVCETQQSPALIETLEARRLLSAVYPTANEQLMVELVNRARANPAAEASSFNIALNEGLAAGTISTAAKQPLAVNPYITDAARGHSQYLTDNNAFAHSGVGNGDPKSRMEDAGYNFTGSWTYGENIAWRGIYPSTPNETTYTSSLHRALFVDENYPGRGHRVSMLNDNFREIGAGVVSGRFTSGGTTYNSVMATTNFGKSGSSIYMTGVAIDESVADNDFYDVGEGLGNITITARNVATSATYVTSTWEAGGYSLALPAGTYDITATGEGLGTVYENDVTIGSKNIKVDFMPGSGDDEPTPEPDPDTTAPTATLNAEDVEFSRLLYQFTVTYTDNEAIDASTIDDSVLRVSGPDNFAVIADMVLQTSDADTDTITAYYNITPPGGQWDPSNNGTYTITMQTDAVADTSGNNVETGVLGQFTVDAPDDLAGDSPSPYDSRWIGTFDVGRRKSVYDTVEPLDKNDYYRFKVPDGGIRIWVRGDFIEDDIDIQITLSNGTPIRTISRDGTAIEVGTRIMRPGSYYMRVYNVGNSATSYRLKVEAKEPDYVLPSPSVVTASAVRPTFASLFSQQEVSDEPALLDL